jgi:glycosyltransferase A (GT-A) superfamily protein (DUF2064 family)
VTGRVALAVMAKVPAAGEVKTRLCPPLAPAEAAALARCFLLDRLDQLGEVSDGDALVAFTPKERDAGMRALVPAGIRLVPQEGADLGTARRCRQHISGARAACSAIPVGRNNSIRPSGRMVIHMMQAPEHRLPDDPARRVGRGRRS